jgi:signal transduction histidine kinase
MRIISKTTLYFLVIAVVVFTIGGFITFNLIRSEVDQETDFFLRSALINIENQIKNGVNSDELNSERVQIKKVDRGPATEPVFSDTLAMHQFLKRLESHRKLTVTKEIDSQFYHISIFDILFEQDDIFESVLRIIIWLFSLLALAVILGSLIINRQILKPFKKTLERISTFRIKGDRLDLPNTRTREFTQLNRFINNMTVQAQKDYQILKKFSEDASHEIQTPLAIAQGKLELLANENELTQEQSRLIETAQNALTKLSKIGTSLTLLSKIENREFSTENFSDLSKMVEETVDNFTELSSIRGIELKSNIQPDISVRMNPRLGEILLNNLMSNALKHNSEGGYIHVDLSEEKLEITNSGAPPPGPTEEMFNRFVKDPNKQESSGLGLAIVKEICDYHGMGIDYSYNGEHRLVLNLNRG